MLDDSSRILISGGDRRLNLSDGLMKNQYGCVPYPIDHLSYSSCTASTIGKRAYNWVRVLHESRSLDPTLKEEFQSVRDRIRSQLATKDEVDIALGPSGTDMELIALLATAWSSTRISNIIIGEEEVGSGIALAAKGRHFSTSSPIGRKTAKAETIPGFEDFDIDLVPVALRDSNTGQVYSREYLDQVISETIHHEVQKGRRVLLHLVYRTKTGVVAPDLELVSELKSSYPEALDVVADCCQYRMTDEKIRRFLDAECMVIITGSKFFGGAPFSAALLVPSCCNHRFRQNWQVPKGLGMYFSRNEMPQIWTCFDNILPLEGNLGLLLRWESALFEMQEFQSIHYDKFKRTSYLFQELLEKRVQESEYCELIHVSPVYDRDFQETDLVYQCTLQTIGLKHPKRELCIDDAGLVYQGLYTDMSEVVPGDKEVLRTICHLGQPAKIRKGTDNKWTATLRLALSARHFSDRSGQVEHVQRENIDREMYLIVKKIELLIENLEQLRDYL